VKTWCFMWSRIWIFKYYLVWRSGFRGFVVVTRDVSASHSGVAGDSRLLGCGAVSSGVALCYEWLQCHRLEGQARYCSPSQCCETPIVSASYHSGQGSSSRTFLFGYIANLCLVQASAWTLAILISFVVFLSTPRLVPRLGQARFLPDALWYTINRSVRCCVVWNSENVVK
jgi:hypothetical protein